MVLFCGGEADFKVGGSPFGVITAYTGSAHLVGTACGRTYYFDGFFSTLKSRKLEESVAMLTNMLPMIVVS